MKKQIKVTFKTNFKIKEGRKWISKSSEIVEIMASDADYRLRALALNWEVVKVEAL
jgi:hypothetical protein